MQTAHRERRHRRRSPHLRPGRADIRPAWLATHFNAEKLATPALETTVGNDLADPDTDDRANILEYSLAYPAPS